MFNAPAGCVSTDNRNILVKGNRFWGYGAHPNAYSNPIGAVRISNAQNVVVEGNEFGEPANPSTPGLKKLSIVNCTQVTVKNNTGLAAQGGY
jgi:hypothetical protein